MNGSRELVRPNSTKETRALAQAIANLIDENGLSYQEAMTVVSEVKSKVGHKFLQRMKLHTEILETTKELERIKQKFDQGHDPTELMNEMEVTFGIPAMYSQSFTEANLGVMWLYWKISDSRFLDQGQMEAEKEKAILFADEIAEVSEKVQSGEMTLNQARIRLGFKPIEGGDEYVILESKVKQI